MSNEKLTCYVERATLKALKRAAKKSGVPVGEIVDTALQAALKGAADPNSTLGDTLDYGPSGALRWARAWRKGGDTLEAIATQLNADGYRTAHGREWTFRSVWRLLRKG